MAETIEFVSNYNDHSTDMGFQFEFQCNRCSTGYRTSFQPYAAGTVSNVLDGASSLLGGIFNQASNISNRVRSAGWQQARDQAFSKAIQEIKPHFIQCPRCQAWVCRDKCWNNKKGLCKNCAPDLAVEMSAAQSSRTVEEIWAHSKVAEEDRQMLEEKSWREGVRATCPQCEAPLATNAKFCPNCGAKVAGTSFCAECGAKLQPGAKFCPECGKKVGG